ncbi:hypothetical protein PAPYR_12620 [Paratrimastix pyriformis]|uniref:Uncharacterized protein n=1 Tax=Paratrimastix pyriformis TaxID=342808 RepID=A0ABQ8U1L0_9EUKA|nr:hypothetical protein PAPYR_12620 [Paratrimastix pyriformis]
MMPRQAPGYEVRCSPLLNRTYDFFQPEDKTEVHLSRQAFTTDLPQAAGELGLSARALLITLLLDSEAAFDIDHPSRSRWGSMRSSSGNALTPSTSGVLRDRSLLERTDYYGEQFPKVFLACEREYLSLSADERKTYDWSIQCHKFRTSTCSRELPTLWDFLLTGPSSAFLSLWLSPNPCRNPCPSRDAGR